MLWHGCWRVDAMAVQHATNVQRNRLLNALSDADFALLQPHLEAVPLNFRQRLQSANRRITKVYFLESGIASVVATGNGQRRQAEVALIGREGMTGLAVVNDAERSPWEVFIQVEGAGLCISTDRLRAAMEAGQGLRRCFHRFAQVFNVQCGFAALANAQGKIDPRKEASLAGRLPRLPRGAPSGGGSSSCLSQPSQCRPCEAKRL